MMMIKFFWVAAMPLLLLLLLWYGPSREDVLVKPEKVLNQCSCILPRPMTHLPHIITLLSFFFLGRGDCVWLQSLRIATASMDRFTRVSIVVVVLEVRSSRGSIVGTDDIVCRRAESAPVNATVAFSGGASAGG